MDASDFVAKWRKASLQNEMQVYTDHLDDLCRLANHPTRLEYDHSGERFAVQKSVTKVGGTTGAADAWFRGHFAIEYKGKGGNLDEAYRQLLEYRDNLENPPLLIVSDLDRIVIRTNYTGRTTRKIELSIDSFASGAKVGDTGLTAVEVIRKCFYEPLDLVPEETTEKLTEKVAERFRFVSDFLKQARSARYDPVTRDYPRLYVDLDIAKFLIRLVFCMFASDIGLLEPNIVSTIIRNSRTTARATAEQFAELFEAMRTGGHFGPFNIKHFNGGLFADAEVIEVDSFSLAEILAADQENWADVEPSIFGTLFERIIDEKQRRALGKHYTSRQDIELLIEPVIMWPLLREWGGESAIDGQPNGGLRRDLEDSLSYNKYDTKRRADAHMRLQTFIDRLGTVRVLDPACGSGNFLYIALEKLRALEHEAVKFGLAWDLPKLERKVHPRQLFGIEKNEYAHQLASTVVWIGYLQSKRRQGDYSVDDPVLEPLNNIQLRDAILDLSDPANPKEPEWPEADFIVGNPPFLGGKMLIGQLGEDYVAAQRAVYQGRVQPFGDLCCYWFEKAREIVAKSQTARAGLLATQSIRGGASRFTLQRILDSGGIFFAESDRPWILDGAAVHVSLIGFDGGTESRRLLDGRPVEGVHPDLTADANVSSAAHLTENGRLSFIGVQRGGPFDLTEPQAEAMGRLPNPNGRPNFDVIKRIVNGSDLLGRDSNTWVVDFYGYSEAEAALYEEPFKWVRQRVAPVRAVVRRKAHRERWWQFGDTRPGLRTATAAQDRYLVTPRISKHRILVWVRRDVLPDSAVVAFARDDDYFFGVLQSHAHEVWALQQGTQLESRPRYTPTTCFETFPLPWPPGKEPVGDPLHTAIAEAARELNELRENWLNPPANADGSPALSEEQLKKRTLTNLYNEMTAGEKKWLADAHEKLDRAVFAAYGWEYPLDEQEILSRLLAENLRRAGVTSSD